MPTPPTADKSTLMSGVARPGEGRLRRVLSLVLVVMMLAWAWQVSGLGDATKLWHNRDRAVDYIFGQRVDETTLQSRREQALRDVRTEFQTRAREELEEQYRARGEPVPSFMQLMKTAEQRGSAELDKLSQAEIDRLVQKRLDAQGEGGSRRGGYFPPETRARALFGDPERLRNLPWPFSGFTDAADRAGESVRIAVRWVVCALVGDGYTGALLETIAISLWGTILGVIAALPLSLVGADRTLKVIVPGESRSHRLVRWFGKFVVRRSFDLARGFNEIVLAMILVAVLGLGPLPGVLALAIHTYGVLGKVFADAMDTTDMRPIEGVQSTGAAWSQVICFAVLPQIMPAVVSQSLLRLESNVRGATILGVVGAGGIGQLLMDKFGAYEFREVCTMMIIIIVVVTLIDFACAKVMKRFV